MHSNLLQLLGKKFDDLIEGLTLLELENQTQVAGQFALTFF